MHPNQALFVFLGLIQLLFGVGVKIAWLAIAYHVARSIRIWACNSEVIRKIGDA